MRESNLISCACVVMRRLVHEEGKSLVHLLRQIFEGLLLHPLVRPRKVGVQRTTYVRSSREVISPKLNSAYLISKTSRHLFAAGGKASTAMSSCSTVLSPFAYKSTNNQKTQ